MRTCHSLRVAPGQFHDLIGQILAGRAEDYYIRHVNWDASFRTVYDALKRRFDVHQEQYFTEWTTTSFQKLRTQHPEKPLPEDPETNVPLRMTLVRACRGVPELEPALFRPALRIEELFSDLRSSLETHLARRPDQQFFGRARGRSRALRSVRSRPGPSQPYGRGYGRQQQGYILAEEDNDDDDGTGTFSQLTLSDAP
ncbi:polyprotein [Ophiocordyceps sinensis CO18]|uniref:Polyprotein n=1 Tax=Ophiocordyceps sinensis (strain Co18 / CGMCC 3.14243) TaxID=911162 RepID=T5ADG0_OPHSC|nr:polyprotein [Ophiocordyceps sinensis CO18]